MQKLLQQYLTEIISETNGITISETLDLLLSSDLKEKNIKIYNIALEFRDLLSRFQVNTASIGDLLKHPLSEALFQFLKNFPLRYREEHIHLTGSLSAEFVFPRLQKLLNGPHKDIYEKKIIEVYGAKALPIRNEQDVDRLIRIKENEGFATYMKILYLPKLVLISKQAHEEAAYHMAENLYQKFNVGQIRLKFSLSRATSDSTEQIPGSEEVSSEDVILGLYDGFKKFQNQHPDFKFILSPSFRKEKDFYDKSKFKDKKSHFMQQINEILNLIDRYPYLAEVLNEVDTVGDEKDLYRKEHFNELKLGFRKLQYRGFKVRSHHGESWYTLRKGIQAVDNAMNIWHIDTLEHGISLGINPNKYFHQLYQSVLQKNRNGQAVLEKDPEYRELIELDWESSKPILDKLLQNKKLTSDEEILFLKAKFHTAREVEHYQHDVLNRLIQKDVSLVSLPSSNKKLTGKFADYKDHPFSWWEKKNVSLGVGTDNYITLNTNFIQEMMIVLYMDSANLKLTKLLMVVTGETNRPYISHLLWKMRKKVQLLKTTAVE